MGGLDHQSEKRFGNIVEFALLLGREDIDKVT
jgi:hypothetical protein